MYIVDCKWGPWSEESKCTATCGIAVKVLRRSIITKSEHGGSRCTGKAIKREPCDLDPCPST